MQSQELKKAVKDACKKLFEADIEPEISRPDEKFGDYATNAALQLAKKAAATPRQIAEQLVQELQGRPGVAEVTIAGPGFINFKITDESLAQAAMAAADLPKPNSGREILVEFGDPNPFKEMHIGHLYSYIIGDSICRLLETTGAAVRRLSYHGDVGLHVAKAIYGLQEQEEKKGSKDEPQDFLGKAYAYGNQKYENDEEAKARIDEINQHIYAKDDPQIDQLYQQGIQLSFAHFDKILNLLSISTDKRYLESEATPVGIESVRENIGQVFKHSQGAIVYEGEKAGLHTRVFITSKGLPTYETKDLGLAELKHMDYPKASKSVVITANEQTEYFKVMLAALAEFNPDLASKTTHLAHGFLSLSTGKMSSRTGNVYTADSLLEGVKAAVEEKYPDSDSKNEVYLAATKYSMLKHRLGQDIIIDVEESVSLEGNSGPYLQYAHARACSILEKASSRQQVAGEESSLLPTSYSLQPGERTLARKIGEYPEIIEKAVNELMPHHIGTYLYELAQAFNSFYETSRIIGDEREALRLRLVTAYQRVLASGLNILNIAAPEHM